MSQINPLPNSPFSCWLLRLIFHCKAYLISNLLSFKPLFTCLHIINPSPVAERRTMEEGNFNRKDLCKKAMDMNWDSVFEAYESYPSVREAKVTRTKQTILHLAASRKDDNAVERLVKAIPAADAFKILTLKNDLGDTPLHVAAKLGLAKICWLLAEKCKNFVVSVPNNMGETPLYVAVRYGKKEAFFVLQDYVPASMMSGNFAFCQREDGNTILHAAVHAAYFELAIEIIRLYPRLVNFNNKMGQSPLHLLANKPLVFKSSCSILRLLHRGYIYRWMIVDKLEPKYQPRIYMSPNNEWNGWKKETEIKILHNYPRLGIKIPIIDHYCRLMDFYADKRYRMNRNTANKGQSSKDGLHAPTSEGQERDEESGRHVSSTEPRFSDKNNLPNYVGQVLGKFFGVLTLIVFSAFNFLKILIELLMAPFKLDIPITERLKRRKKMHEDANQVMKELIDLSCYWEYDKSGKMPKDEDNEADKPIIDSPFLVAAKRGIVEMVKHILDTFPVAIEDLDSNHKNIILLSAEHRQLNVYKHILERRPMLDSVFAAVDKDGNSALHLVAGATINNSPSLIVGPALQMQWEIKWYKFVRDSMEPSLFQYYNNKGQTPQDIFLEAHQSLVKEGREWLRNTSQSCSVIATLIATMAFAFSKTVPGGVDQTSGFPTFKGKHAFTVFAQSTTAALFFSIISVLIFLNTLTTHYKEWHFKTYVPWMLSTGLITLFMSIVSMLISFIASYILVMEDYKSLPVFVCSCILVILSMLQLPVFKDMTRAVPSDVPELFL